MADPQLSERGLKGLNDLQDLFTTHKNEEAQTTTLADDIDTSRIINWNEIQQSANPTNPNSENILSETELLTPTASVPNSRPI
ncbi:MAG TPA: hypothetical protein PL009_09275 [Flavipsychrobacter sp.]|nr:hypothetical protein [Flavipsychrobacter sp.]